MIRIHWPGAVQGLAAISAIIIGGAGCSRTEATFAASPESRSVGTSSTPDRTVLTGKEALGDWTTDAPGVRRKITVADLPEPYASRSVDNGPRMVPPPEGAWPKAPVGFVVTKFATGLNNPREVITAPNGDLFVVESKPGRVRVLRDGDGDGKPEENEIYVAGLRQPFGMTFYPNGPNPQYLFVANTDSVVRFPYRDGDLKASGPEEVVVPNLPGGGQLRGGGHWTRDIRFSADNRTMFVSVGSLTNDYENPSAPEERRADILAYTPDGRNERIYASGIRNAVGLAIHPQTADLWASVNERDELGDHLPPDYITRVKEGGFYGWPWFYIGPHQDPRHPGAHPELKNQVIVPDVLVQSHMASLCICFYTGSQFPAEYRNDGFAAQHGSWNRGRRTGYKVIRVPLKNGVPTGEYEDFLTGFVTPEGNVWGRPVGVTTARDGALLVTDDGSGTVWRVAYGK